MYMYTPPGLFPHPSPLEDVRGPALHPSEQREQSPSLRGTPYLRGTPFHEEGTGPPPPPSPPLAGFLSGAVLARRQLPFLLPHLLHIVAMA